MNKENGVLTDVGKEDIELLNSNPKKFWEGVAVIGDNAFFNCKFLTLVNVKILKNT